MHRFPCRRGARRAPTARPPDPDGLTAERAPDAGAVTLYSLVTGTFQPIYRVTRQTAVRSHKMAPQRSMTKIDEIVENFTLLDEWDDRYRYVIELGRALPPMPESAHTDANKVQGCASQVWLISHVTPDGANGPVMTFEGDSDAHIVRGLVAILIALYSGKGAREILATDALELFDRIGLRENLTPQRSNGLRSMVERIRTEATTALAAA